MTTQSENHSNAKSLPSHRVTFSRITGKDESGNDILGPAREIGAIWDRKGDKKGGILKFDHIPAELAMHQGVLFILPVDQHRRKVSDSQAEMPV